MITGVYVGRFSPIHIAHEQVINKMLEIHGDGSLIVIGSCNTPPSMRHFFSYVERRGFVQTLFPNVPTIPLPDFVSDDDWMLALDDMITLGGGNPHEVVFYGGCEEDLVFFLDRNRKCEILNRFDGTTPKISATEVRNALLHGQSLDGMVNPKIQSELAGLFHEHWQVFSKH